MIRHRRDLLTADTGGCGWAVCGVDLAGALGASPPRINRPTRRWSTLRALACRRQRTLSLPAGFTVRAVVRAVTGVQGLPASTFRAADA
jgi:hypothetical protein